MTRLTAALVSAALLLPAGARADDLASDWAATFLSPPSSNLANVYKELDAGQCPSPWHHCKIWKSTSYVCDDNGKCKIQGGQKKWQCTAKQEGSGAPLLMCYKTASLDDPTSINTHPDHSYHLLTISNGGTVSLIKGLTKRECDIARAQVLPPLTTTWHKVEPGDIKSAECFQ